MNEAQTRLDLIDPALKKAGWGEVSGSRIRVEFPITDGRIIGKNKRASKLSADYVLEYKNRRLAVIEAKAKNKYYTDGLGQAKDYAERLNIRYTYATNGVKIYGVDMQEGAEGDVTHYPTPDELWEMTFPTPIEPYKVEIADWKARLDSIPFHRFKGKYLPRYYQHNAALNALDAIATGKNRILLTMATGTGKTATAFHICWKLFHAKWNLKRDASRAPRILFLADRNLLADQAFNSFGDFEEDALVRITPSDIKKKGKVPTNGNVFFTIFQSFMSGDEETPYFGEYPKDFFDFIIIDECHRGGAKDESTWRAILDYFSPAVQMGLTATPKRDINADTYDYFGKPVYTYSLKDGINDGFLTPFKVKEISTTIDKYTFTEDDEVVGGDVDTTREYTEKDFNQIIEIKAREEYRVKLFMNMINQSQKTLVFCATQIHAAAVRDLINQYKTSKSTKYCERVTADDGKIGEQHLRDFQDNEKSIPTILTTSQKLSTGVDAPEIRNIVLMRPVNSMIEFKQIVGRGTRLFDGKDYFTVYDFVEAHNHFKDPEWDGEPLDPAEPKPKGEGKTCLDCNSKPCVCLKEPEEPCYVCGNDPCVCEGEERKMITIVLADGKKRELDSMVKTTFWDPNGTPISLDAFVKKLYGDMPSLFSSEEELRKIWSLPSTRKKLLQELNDLGYSAAQLEDLRKLVHGEDSDLFDVLNYIGYSTDLVPRLDRAQRAKVQFSDYNKEQQQFLNFVLKQYVKGGVDELDDAKLGDLLMLNYGGIADAKEKLGNPTIIRNTFIGFQEYLYQKNVV
ncbi:EcoAI/FtnUII family type I restriction enzme subunit R [Tenacibaculum halocynthiae]|uniref:EcoAI/FtnUII family type I restriction enzme subunit R n=1 Tax=Tenacibaculum halocynthiae TaxID=1254437 RepID=UPI003D65DE7C